MTEQISDKRKEEMARWLGFQEVEIQDIANADYWYPAWDYPDGRSELELPDFPNDIAACFKWIVPEVNKRGYIVSTYIYPKGCQARLVHVSDPDKPVFYHWEDDKNKLATAIFLAAEQLMKAV